MRFNDTKRSIGSNRTENYEGGEAFEPASPELALYKVVINNLLEDTYYREDEDALRDVRQRFEWVADSNPEFVLKLAAYAREEMYLRDISQLLLVLSAADERTKGYVRKYAPDIIQRADEPATVVAMWDALFGGTLPKPLKKAINDALHTFDSYQFSKYDTDRREVNLRDVLNRTHPKPRDEEHDEIFERLMLGRLDDHPEIEPLETPETWETVISERGNTAEAWRDVLPRMGLFATIRNFRNMREAGLAGEEIVDEDDLAHVRESKIYPFRFYQSYKAIMEARVADAHLERWLSDAVDIAAENLPDRLESTHVSVDLSGSMSHALSERSAMTYKEIAAFFGAVLMHKGAETSVFASNFGVIDAHVDTPTLELTNGILQARVGGSTNGWLALKHLVENDTTLDRVVLLTDMQIWDSTGFRQTESVRDWFDTYREQVAPEASLYMIDLSSYGDLVTPEGYEDVYNISGWNEQIIDFIRYAEDERQIINEIDGYSVD